MTVQDIVNAIASYQSTLLLSLAGLLVVVAFVFMVRPKVFTVYATDAEDPNKVVPVLTQGYHRLMLLISIIGWGLGALATYAALWLGWNQAADPATLIFLFLGGASVMHLNPGHPQLKWAWILAPVLAGVSTLELWGFLAASPDLWVSVAGTLGLMVPLFIILVYVEHGHETIGTLLITSTGAFCVAIICILQAVALMAGLSLWMPVQGYINTLIERILPILGGI